jgi:hypothetical protein
VKIQVCFPERVTATTENVVDMDNCFRVFTGPGCIHVRALVIAPLRDIYSKTLPTKTLPNTAWTQNWEFHAKRLSNCE